MNHTITFTESELNTIDVTLRMRVFMIQLELNDPGDTSEYHLNQLRAEQDRIVSLLDNHDIFVQFRDQYKRIFDN